MLDKCDELKIYGKGLGEIVLGGAYRKPTQKTSKTPSFLCQVIFSWSNLGMGSTVMMPSMMTFVMLKA